MDGERRMIGRLKIENEFYDTARTSGGGRSVHTSPLNTNRKKYYTPGSVKGRLGTAGDMGIDGI
jgi:hypothetical protein